MQDQGPHSSSAPDTIKNELIIKNNELIIKELIEFQVNRAIFGLCKQSLRLLEDNKEKRKSLEKILTEIGIEVKISSEEDFQQYRRATLNETHDAINEINGMLKKLQF